MSRRRRSTSSSQRTPPAARRRRAAGRPLAVAAAAAALLAAGCARGTEARPLPGPATGMAIAPDFAGTIWTVGGAARVSRDGGNSWRAVAGARRVLAVAFADGRTVVAGPRGVQWSTLGGAPMSRPRPVPPSLVALATPYHRTGRLYGLDRRGRLWISPRAAEGWNRLAAGGLPGPAGALAAVRDDPRDPDVLWVAAGGALWRSDDFGATFRRVAAAGRGVGALATTPADPDRLLAATADGLRLSTDRGRSFRRVGPAASAVAISPRNSLLALAATADGLLVSVDGGETFGDP